MKSKPSLEVISISQAADLMEGNNTVSIKSEGGMLITSLEGKDGVFYLIQGTGETFLHIF